MNVRYENIDGSRITVPDADARPRALDQLTEMVVLTGHHAARVRRYERLGIEYARWSTLPVDRTATVVFREVYDSTRGRR